jgi:hypothetical protein
MCKCPTSNIPGVSNGRDAKHEVCIACPMTERLQGQKLFRNYFLTKAIMYEGV